MIDTANIKLAIQAAWSINDPAFALMLALRDHALRGLCLQCANGHRRLTQGRDGQMTIWLICRQCSREDADPHRRASRIPVFVASIQTPPPLGVIEAPNSLWFDTTEMRVHARSSLGWRLASNSEELFELLGVEPAQIHYVMSSYASTVEAAQDE